MSYISKVDQITFRRLSLMLIIIGILFGLDMHLQSLSVWKYWPLILTLLGLGLLVTYKKRLNQESFFLVLGLFVLQFSILALVCNFYTWGSLYKVWPLFIIFLGTSLVSTGIIKRQRFLTFFSLILITLGAVFLVVLTVGAQYWWVLFILLGISIFIAGGIR